MGKPRERRRGGLRWVLMVFFKGFNGVFKGFNGFSWCFFEVLKGVLMVFLGDLMGFNKVLRDLMGF